MTRPSAVWFKRTSGFIIIIPRFQNISSVSNLPVGASLSLIGGISAITEVRWTTSLFSVTPVSHNSSSRRHSVSTGTVRTVPQPRSPSSFTRLRCPFVSVLRFSISETFIMSRRNYFPSRCCQLFNLQRCVWYAGRKWLKVLIRFSSTSLLYRYARRYRNNTLTLFVLSHNCELLNFNYQISYPLQLLIKFSSW